MCELVGEGRRVVFRLRKRGRKKEILDIFMFGFPHATVGRGLSGTMAGWEKLEKLSRYAAQHHQLARRHNENKSTQSQSDKQTHTHRVLLGKN